eukprot:1151459-Pelagomonas_calceolata.AAC.3
MAIIATWRKLVSIKQKLPEGSGVHLFMATSKCWHKSIMQVQGPFSLGGLKAGRIRPKYMHLEASTTLETWRDR